MLTRPGWRVSTKSLADSGTRIRIVAFGFVARRAGVAPEQVLAALPFASLEPPRSNIVETSQRIGERERACRDPVVVNNEIPRPRKITEAGRVLVFPSGKLVHIDRIRARDPIARARQLDRRSAVEQQVDVYVLVGIRQAFCRLERLDRMPNGIVVDPVQEQSATSHLE